MKTFKDIHTTRVPASRPPNAAGAKPVPAKDAHSWAVAPAGQSKCRSLLALDGETLSQDLLTLALKKCLQVADRVDILLVNSPKAPTSLLCDLLIKLEHAGIDYRLTASSGRLCDQINQYIRRFFGVAVIMVTALPTLGANWRINVANLRQQGYRFMTLVENPAGFEYDAAAV